MVFFEDCKKLEPEKYEHVKVEKFENKAKAMEIVRTAIEKYKSKN